MGTLKDKIVSETLNRPFRKDDLVYVSDNTITFYYGRVFKVLNVLSDTEIEIFSTSDRTKMIVRPDQIKYYMDNIGYNPMIGVNNFLQNWCEYTIGQFVSNFKYKEENEINGVYVPEYNFNPYVTDKDGNKIHYQRDYVWTIEDEQSLIEAIYNQLDCGVIVVKERSYKEVEDLIASGETELGFYDIIDGKQRLHTLERFVNDEFSDRNGYYYSDFCEVAKRIFRQRKAFKVVHLKENVTDEDVINAFLTVNYSGKPMSKEHIDFVVSLRNKI